MFTWLPFAFAGPCSGTSPAVQVALVDQPALTESSGLARSERRPGWWFTHNDSGGRPVVYAFDLAGGFEAHEVTGAEAIDWEDMAAGPCPESAARCLYLADIGDNDRERPSVTVYAVVEPGPGEAAPVIARWDFTYQHGADNAETLLVHPRTGALTVVTKSGSGRSRVVPLPGRPPGEVVTLAAVGTVEVVGESGSERKITGGDWSPDGARVALRTYTHVREWAGQDRWWTSPPLTTTPTAEEVRGEAFAYQPDGGWLTTSEGRPMPVHRQACRD